MFILSHFVDTLADFVFIVLTLYYWLVIGRAIISWVNPDPYNVIVQFLIRVTEPILTPIRRLLPNLPIDISPILACVAIVLLRKFLVGSLHDLAMRLVVN